MKKNIEILTEAINKAIKNGYPDPMLNYNIGHYLDRNNYYSIIFDKDFAKAIWGESTHEPVHPYMGENCVLWKLHIKQMLLAKEPLQYLGEKLNIDNWGIIIGDSESELLNLKKNKI